MLPKIMPPVNYTSKAGSLSSALPPAPHCVFFRVPLLSTILDISSYRKVTGFHPSLSFPFFPSTIHSKDKIRLLNTVLLPWYLISSTSHHISGKRGQNNYENIYLLISWSIHLRDAICNGNFRKVWSWKKTRWLKMQLTLIFFLISPTIFVCFINYGRKKKDLHKYI